MTMTTHWLAVSPILENNTISTLKIRIWRSGYTPEKFGRAEGSGQDSD
jgi:hypothetical protein